MSLGGSLPASLLAGPHSVKWAHAWQARAVRLRRLLTTRRRRDAPGRGARGALPTRLAPADPEVVAGARPAGRLDKSRVAERRRPAAAARRGPL